MLNQKTLDKLDFHRIQDALAMRAQSLAGKARAKRLMPNLSQAEILTSWQCLDEAVHGTPISLGGVEDIRPFIEAVKDGRVLEGRDILNIAYTMDAAGSIKRSILNSNRPHLGELAKGMRSFEGALRLVREQLDLDGQVRDDATPKLKDIRRRLNPLRGRIRERLQELLERYRDSVQDPIITLRRDRYVIPIKVSDQSKVPGIILDSSDSGATVFMEPQGVVNMNNELAILEFEERDEVRRILIALGQRLAYEEGLEATLDILAELDVIAASARLVKDWQLAQPSFNDKGEVKLLLARHPLIENCVPNSIELNEANRLLVITGPNAGGKTVLLKTLGLAVLMAHSGLYIAASQKHLPSLPYIEEMLCDIGDEQSIEASLSTYAGHLTNLKRIVQEASPKVLILIDELGSGTDPAEGAALSQAIIEAILKTRARGLINTHLAPLKVFAAETTGIQNAAMQFDVSALKPKYELVVGQPGRSYALAIAERIGLPASLLTRAQVLIGEKGAELETLLETLETQREELSEKLLEAEVARDEAIQEAKTLRKHISALRQQEAQVIAKAAEKADEMLQSTLKQATELKRTAQQDKQNRGKALEELQALRRNVKQKISPASESSKPKRSSNSSPPELEPGAFVFVESYGAKGNVIELRGDEALVQLGLLKVTVSLKQLKLENPPKKPKVAKGGASFMSPSNFDNELNLRGERAEAAIEKVRDFLLEARALKVPSVRILHGKGTGVLREAIRDYLKNERFIERYEDAVPYEGGHGVTVAYFRP
ncbi:MAG: endonuclease MutS2 [Deinococcales bacterium]